MVSSSVPASASVSAAGPPLPVFDPRPFLAQLTTQAGVYRYYDARDQLLYVGKARNLKKRVSTYFLRASGNARIERMVDQIRRAEVTITRTEDEALVLEATLIKELHPRYNILYRDDKSYPFLRFSAHKYPRISFYRGQKANDGRYFGPYPSSAAVRDALNTLQKLFQLRPCTDVFFANRDRPCLQHQIHRCTAPCVKRITPEAYGAEIASARRLLEGKSQDLSDDLGHRMEKASEDLDFEAAARLRDQIVAIRRLRETRAITGGSEADLDAIAVAPHAGGACVVVMTIRDGMNLGHHSHYPTHAEHATPGELLASFLAQHYLEVPPPPVILVSDDPVEGFGGIGESEGESEGSGETASPVDDDILLVPIAPASPDGIDETIAVSLTALPLAGTTADSGPESLPLGQTGQTLARLLSARAERKVRILRPQRGERAKLMDMARRTADQALSQRLVETSSMEIRRRGLQEALDLPQLPVRLECFDISHTMGEKPVASCVVFGPEGAMKIAYRKFNIQDITPGDDYAAIRQAVLRRYTRIQNGEFPAPDVLFIDGGAGQLKSALAALEEVGIVPPALTVVAIAKGPTRKPGLEELLIPGRDVPLKLPPNAPALHLIQQIRDEAHRFAITGHRARRDKSRLTSGLEAIEGLGPARRRSLLKAFGGIAQIKRAGVDEIAGVEGVSQKLAERIHAHFR